MSELRTEIHNLFEVSERHELPRRMSEVVEVQEFYESRIGETEKKIESLKGMKAFLIDNLLV